MSTPGEFIEYVFRIGMAPAVLCGGPQDGHEFGVDAYELRAQVRYVPLPLLPQDFPADLTAGRDSLAVAGPSTARYIWHGEVVDGVAQFRYQP